MTVSRALALADELKPNLMSTEAKYAFLNEIEAMIHGELIMTHAHTAEEEECPVYTVPEETAGTEETVTTEEQGTETETTEETEEEEAEDTDPELLIPSPYDMLYPYYIITNIDYLNQEMDKYNNDRAIFENKYQQAADWINRTRMPIRKVREINI